ncbi:MAG: succinate dehydrogenase [Phycisphaerae bacterium]
MSEISSAVDGNGLGATGRRDAWWVGPLLVVLGLSAFGIYSTWAAWTGNNYLLTAGGADYLSPFYSPDLKSLLGISVPFSYAFLILWVPLGFRASCYYYRKSYYRAFFLDPAACAVGEPKGRKYKGETKFPFILQNFHRYFFYLATVVLLFLWYDAGRAFFFADKLGQLHFGVGVGSIIMLLNVIALSGFSLGCNSLRHLTGGKLDCFSCSAAARTRYKLWGGVTFFNLRHMEWAWVSLFSVGLTDLYIRLCCMGVLHDIRIF